MFDPVRTPVGRDTPRPPLVIASRDRRILRELAQRVAALAARPGEAVKREMWYKLNALEDPGRPLVFCDPENGWTEIIAEDDLRCMGSIAREWELALRKEIFWGEHLICDKVIEPQLILTHQVLEETDWGLPVVRHGGTEGGAFAYEPPLTSYEKDFARLRHPRVLVDYRATHDLMHLAHATFDGILSVRLAGAWWWTLGMTWTLMTLRGLEPFMRDMCEQPEWLKRTMAFLRDGTLAQLDYLEREGLLTLNNGANYVGSGGFGYSRELPQQDFVGHVRTQDLWGFCESQETVQVSPQQFEEFVFSHQLPILERFGLNCYGCCEPLDARWHMVRRIPRLRRVSVSPWANRARMAENLQDQYIYSMKTNPVLLSDKNADLDGIRDYLRESMAMARGCRLEIIQQDTHTLGGSPQNAIDWCRIAMEEAARQ